MNMFTQIVVTFLSGGLGAGIVTFVLNSLKADRDFLRSKLETLYLAVDKYTELNTSISALLLTGYREELKALLQESKAIEEHIHQMIVIIDLYFHSCDRRTINSRTCSPKQMSSASSLTVTIQNTGRSIFGFVTKPSNSKKQSSSCHAFTPY